MIKEKLKPEANTNNLTSNEYELVLFNDDFNTFEYVIDALIEICNLESLQAEQITLTVHLKGKCGVISGDFTSLKPMFNALSLKGLTVEIQ